MDNIIRDCITRRAVLEFFFRFPNREFTIRELSRLSETSYPTTWRFMQKIDKVGIVLCKEIGHSRSCRLNPENPLTEEIKKMLDIPASPQQAILKGLVRKLKGFKEIKEIILFGSVAKGEERLTSDVDVALIVEKGSQDLKNKVTELVDGITARSKVVVVPLILTKRELNEKEQFRQELGKGSVLYVRPKRS